MGTNHRPRDVFLFFSKVQGCRFAAHFSYSCKMDLLTNEAAGLKIVHGWGHVSQVELLVMDSWILAFCKFAKQKKKPNATI